MYVYDPFLLQSNILKIEQMVWCIRNHTKLRNNRFQGEFQCAIDFLKKIYITCLKKVVIFKNDSK